MTDNKSHLEDLQGKLMSEISQGKLKPRSKYFFLAEKLGLNGVLVLSVLLAALFCSLVFFYLQATDNLDYLSFGSQGWYAFLESFPYALIAATILLILLAGFIMKKSGLMYHQPFSKLAVVLVVLVAACGIGLGMSRAWESLEQASYQEQPVAILFRPIFNQGLAPRTRGLAGRIIALAASQCDVQTPFDVRTVILDDVPTAIKEQLATGQFIIAIGYLRQGLFYARDIHIVSDQDMPMIRRGVNRRFGPWCPGGVLQPLPGCQHESE